MAVQHRAQTDGCWREGTHTEPEEALALRVLNPDYTLESLGEHFKLNTNTMAPNFFKICFY